MAWRKRKSRLKEILQCGEGEEEMGLGIDRLLHGQSVIGRTARTNEIETLRFSNDDLIFIGTLDQGQFGKIDLVNCAFNGHPYIRKSISKNMASRARDQCSPRLERDLLLRALQTRTAWAPHLLCAFHTPEDLHLIMSFAPGGTLWDVLESSPTGGISESDLRWWTPQAVSAIHWCHSQGYAHRDIKPHNFVLSEASHLLLIDFGSAAPLLPAGPTGVQLVPKRHCLVPCGTCDYISPEVLRAHEEALVALEMDGSTGSDIEATSRTNGDDAGGYGRETDWWSLGAMLFELAYGVAPFFAKTIGQTYLRIVQHTTSLRFSNAASISPGLKDLLKRLLTDHERRLGRRDITEITDHPFFNGVEWADLDTDRAPSVLHLPNFEYIDLPHDHERPISPNFDDSGENERPFAFSALFQSSPSGSISTPAAPSVKSSIKTPIRPRSRSLVTLENSTKGPASWIGFTWGPPIDAFDHPPSKQRRDLSFDQSYGILPPPQNFSTPARPGLALPHSRAHPPHSVPRPSTVKQSVPRRPVSDREAMKQLAGCIEMSARKRVLESGRKPKVLGAVIGMGTGTTRNDNGAPQQFGTKAGLDTIQRKQLRFDTRPPPFRFDLHPPDGTTTSEETEGDDGSPSPSPRPGSVLSITNNSRRSLTPTLSSAALSLFPPTPRHCEGRSVSRLAPYFPESNASAVKDENGDDLDEMERRYARLMQDINALSDDLTHSRHRFEG